MGLGEGRNKQIRTLGITTDLALLDPSVIRLCSIRFHGRLNIEENSKRKFRSYYGLDWCRIAHEGLKTGDFIRLHKNKIDNVSVPCFKATSKPKQYIIEQPKPQGLIQTLKRIFS